MRKDFRFATDSFYYLWFIAFWRGQNAGAKTAKLVNILSFTRHIVSTDDTRTD
jgi:hypothetical protein